MRYVSIAFALFGSVLTTACDSSPGNRDADLFCEAHLAFADDTARLTFLEGNARAIVGQMPRIMLSSRLSEPSVILVSDRDVCPSSNLDQAFGLHGVDEAVVATRSATLREISLSLSAGSENYQAWNQDDARQCVGHIAIGDADAFALMEPFMASGLRDPFVHADSAKFFFSANESCDFVERVARLSLEQNAVERELHLCPNSSHRACGDPTEFSSGVPSADDVDGLFEADRAEGAQ